MWFFVLNVFLKMETVDNQGKMLQLIPKSNFAY